MYLIFNNQTGQFQLGFRSLKQTTVQHGVSLSQELIEQITDSYYYKNSEFIIINNKYFILEEKNFLIKDFRFIFSNYMFKKLIYLFFILIIKIEKKKKFVLKIFIFLILFLLSIKFFSFGIFNYKSYKISYETPQWKMKDFEVFFKDSKIANSIALNKVDYISQEIPNLKGIYSYRALPLNSMMENDLVFKAQIALPYSTVISLQKDKRIFIKKPLYQCENHKISFYEINENDDILVFKTENFIGENYNFTILREDILRKNLCEESFSKSFEMESEK